MDRSRGSNLKEGTEVEAMEDLLVDLLGYLFYCSQDLLGLGVAPPTVDCTLPHQPLVKKVPYINLHVNKGNKS